MFNCALTLTERMETKLYPPNDSSKEPTSSGQFCAESPTGIERRRAPHRLWSVPVVIMVGMVLNTIMWLTGNATEYEYLPIILSVAGVLVIVHLVTDRRKAKNAASIAIQETLFK